MALNKIKHQKLAEKAQKETGNDDKQKLEQQKEKAKQAKFNVEQ